MIGQMCLDRWTVTISAHQYKLLQTLPDSAPLLHSLSAVWTRGHRINTDPVQQQRPQFTLYWQQLRWWSWLEVSESLHRTPCDLNKGYCTVSTCWWRRANAETATAGREPEPGQIRRFPTEKLHTSCVWVIFTILDKRKGNVEKLTVTWLSSASQTDI